jgi:lipopolysaccharide export system permease protein
VAIRSAGVSVKRIAWSVFKVGGLMMVVALVLGEVLGPVAEDYALNMRNQAISGDIRSHGDKGLWAKDGKQFIQIDDVLTLKHLGKVTLYEIDNQNRIVKVTTAHQANYIDNYWLLHDVQVRDFGSGVLVSESKEKKWHSKLTPEMLDVVRIDPDAQAIVGLYQYVDYLKDNGLASGRYEMAFWGKVVTPLVTIVMMMLALPFVFGPLRSVSIGQRIVVGTLLGLGFHLFNQMSNYVGLVFELNPFLSATMPAFFFTFLAVYLLRRIH